MSDLNMTALKTLWIWWRSIQVYVQCATSIVLLSFFLLYWLMMNHGRDLIPFFTKQTFLFFPLCLFSLYIFRQLTGMRLQKNTRRRNGLGVFLPNEDVLYFIPTWLDLVFGLVFYSNYWFFLPFKRFLFGSIVLINILFKKWFKRVTRSQRSGIKM